MAQWEERYGAGVSDAVQTLDGEQAELLAGRSESGVVELDLTGGLAHAPHAFVTHTRTRAHVHACLPWRGFCFGLGR